MRSGVSSNSLCVPIMSDDSGDFLEILKGQQSSVMTTTAARLGRELSGVHHKDRRFMRSSPDQVRSVQINLRITPRFKQRVSAFATAHNLSVTEVLIRAFDAYAEAHKK
jgi:hypothetical protein